MRPRRRLDPAEQDALKGAVRKSFSEMEQKRDEDHEATVKRLLSHLDRFEGVGDGSGH